MKEWLKLIEEEIRCYVNSVHNHQEAAGASHPQIRKVKNQKVHSHQHHQLQFKHIDLTQKSIIKDKANLNQNHNNNLYHKKHKKIKLIMIVDNQ